MEYNNVYYKLFDYKNKLNTLTLNIKIINHIQTSDIMNELFHLCDENNTECKISNIVMIDELIIVHNSDKYIINTKDINSINYTNTENIVFSQNKNSELIDFKDIIITIDDIIISICVYKLNKPINGIYYGVLFLSKYIYDITNKYPNMINYTKLNNNHTLI
jgi:hypothetical protein